MNMAYNNWKNNYEAEFEEHRKNNFKIVYSYQDDYEYYSNSSEWGMIGDFCNFYRIGTLHKGEKITAKYEELMLNDINIFAGYCKDEFKRIKVWQYEVPLEQAKKIFEYDNMSVRFEDLTTNQRWAFKKVLAEHLKEFDESRTFLKEGFHLY